MARRSKDWRRALRSLAAAALVGGLSLIGCSKQPAAPEAAGGGGGDTSARATPAAKPGEPAAEDLPPPPNDERHQPFAKATRRADDPPPEVQRPPDQTASGKSVARLYSEVVRLWDTIRFTDPRGQHLDYTATIETDLGTIEIALRPDLAPNHVRNFVALARAGYYDGLFFDRIRHDEAEDQPGKPVLDAVEAGCPLGTGEPGYGSIGYWLNPEFPDANAKVTHEEGTVGACHGNEADTAACRFYITLSPAPFLDGNYTIFGKVTRGLDVARKIFDQPYIDEQEGGGSYRPDKPVVIRKVTVQARPAGGSS
jgi:cyclophilin family peptidyl-prolyl cis-trans isomerase